MIAWDAVTQNLYRAYCDGAVALRTLYDQSQTVKLSVSTNYTARPVEAEPVYYVYFYNTDEAGTYLGRTTIGVKHGEAATIPQELASATKPDDQACTYEFIGWVDEDGAPLDLSYMTSDVYAYASYKSALREYTVTWNVGDESISQTYEYGEIPSYDGSTEKSPTVQYNYAFLGWDKTIVPGAGDVTYTAVYDITLNRY